MYYGLSLLSSNLAGNTYLNVALSGLVEMPAYIVAHLALVRLGRRLPLSVSMVLGGIALLSTIFVPSGQQDVSYISSRTLCS